MLAQDLLPPSQLWRNPSFNETGQSIGKFHSPQFSPIIEIRTETRVTEALNARDVVVRRLADVCSSLREKTTLIEQLEKEKLELQEASKFTTAANEREEVKKLVSLIRSLQEEVKSLKLARGEQPPNYEESQVTLEGTPNIGTPTLTASDSLFRTADDPDQRLGERHAVLASLPLPEDIPSDALKPIILPPSFSIHEFLGAICRLIRNQLETYRVFDKLTTAWCPEREEHGYFLAPSFKCITSPRTATAHNWNIVDNVAMMAKPTECFYNRDGQWYYAGTYKAVKLEDLTAAEYSNLSSETTQTLIKETISGRRGASPQTFYEIGQLYAVGALKVSCVGLQCVAFNNVLYRAVLEHAAKFVQTAHGAPALGSGSSGWNGQATISSIKAVGMVKELVPMVSERGSRRDRKENL